MKNFVLASYTALTKKIANNEKEVARFKEDVHACIAYVATVAESDNNARLALFARKNDESKYFDRIMAINEELGFAENAAIRAYNDILWLCRDNGIADMMSVASEDPTAIEAWCKELYHYLEGAKALKGVQA